MLKRHSKISEYQRPTGFILLVLVFLFLSIQNGYARTYYLSSTTGSDAYSSSQATNPATAWKSLEKLNTFFKYLSSGDSVLFKRGDTFSGSIIASKSGSVFAPIYFGAFGQGSKPVVNGMITLNAWKKTGKGVYESTCDATGSNLTINNIPQQIGRYPNFGYSTIGLSSKQTITDNNLPIGLNWTGAEIVIRKTRWIIDKSAISAHNGNTLTFNGNNNAPKNGYGYFIQNDIKTLDRFGEWYYDPSKKTMSVYFGKYAPASFEVNVSTINKLVDINKFNHLSFENIVFSGAGSNTFSITQAKGISIKNCEIYNSGTEAVIASYSPFLKIEDCIIRNSLSGGINMDGGCSNASVVNNKISKTGLMAGMGKSGTGTYEAITSFGDNTQIEKNRIDSVGYNAIYFGGNSSFAKNNYITWFCLTKDDGAGIYLGDWSKTVNKKVEGNIILHGIGNGEGTPRPTILQAEGIYIDDNTESVNIIDNTVSLCSNNGIKIHNAKDIDIYNNTVFNNGIQLRLEQDHYLATSKYIRNNKIRKNTFFSVGNSQTAAKFTTNQDDIHSFGQIDSNIYCKPAKNYGLELAGISGNSAVNINRSAKNVRKSVLTKVQNMSNKNILFEYNATNKVKVIPLNAHYVDVQNNRYSKTVTINPYSSLILLAAEPNDAEKSETIEYSAIINKTYER